MSQYDSPFEEKFYNERRENLAKIAALVRAQNPAITSDLAATYPNAFRFQPESIDVPKIREQYDPLSAEKLEATKPHVAIAGRLVAIRLQGKAGFAQLQQGGQRLQIYVRKDNVGETAFDLYKLLDLGDHIGVSGTLFRTRTNELTLQAASLTFLSKAMLPLPDKFSGLGDIELRYRRRYLDLFTDTGEKPEEAAPSEPPQTPGLEGGFSPLSEPTTERASAPAATTLASPREAGLEGGFSPLSQPTTEGALAPAGTTRAPAREVFVKRSKILRAIRHFFDSRNFLEVETPMLHAIAGGAAARTFDTHHNAEDMRLILRIAPELHLKRLVVGGLDRVYEINRNFRNEGIDRTHNPEFTMLEFYQAYANYNDLMDLTMELIQYVANEVNGTTITHFNGSEIDLSQWTKLSMREAIIKFWPVALGDPPALEDFCLEKFLHKLEAILNSTAVAEIRQVFVAKFQAEKERIGPQPPAGLTASDSFTLSFKAAANLLFDKSDSHEVKLFNLVQDLESATELIRNGEPIGKVIAELFETLAEPHLIQPHIIYDFPLAVSPLSKVKPDEPDWVERFEFYIGGFEVGNAFSELNDADDQLRRFEAQLADRERGDEEAMAEIDHDYVRALGYGLPPTAGEGIGIDRLTMLLTGSRTIRDVILFPLMRPTKPTPEAPPEAGESAE
ncbi:MAG: lysine--tRNA ligase [Acidobacteriota bacterium]